MQALWDVVARYRGRVAGALAFLIVAKVASISVSLVLKAIDDTLLRPDQLTALPILMLASYAMLRFSSTLL